MPFWMRVLILRKFFSVGFCSLFCFRMVIVPVVSVFVWYKYFYTFFAVFTQVGGGAQAFCLSDIVPVCDCPNF